MSLLQVIQSACDLIGIARPTVVVTSTDQQVRQLYRLASEVGAELARDPDQAWQALTREFTFTTVAAEEQVDAIPEDFGWFLPDCFFNRSQSRQMVGPISPQEWQAIKALGSVAPANLLFRERGNSILMIPTPAAGETVAYEYGSYGMATNSVGVPKQGYTADDDGTLLSEFLIVLGIVWKFKQAKGFDYAEDLRTFELEKQRYAGRDGGQRRLNAGYAPWDDMQGLLATNIPQTIPIT